MLSLERIEQITKIFPQSGILLYLLFNQRNKSTSFSYDTKHEDPKERAIVLIPGRNNNTRAFRYILQSNCLKSYQPYTFDYNTRVPIQETLPHLLSFIANINESEISLLGHSKGGLLAKQATLLCDRRIDKLVTLATPHLGTLLVHLPFLERTKSHIDLEDFKNTLDFNPNANLFFNLVPYWDLMILPNSRLLSVYARNVFTNTYGHDSVIYSKRCIDLVSDIFRV